MPLYKVSYDNNRVEDYVLAKDFYEAISKWKKAAAEANEGDECEPESVKLITMYEII